MGGIWLEDKTASVFATHNPFEHTVWPLRLLVTATQPLPPPPPHPQIAAKVAGLKSSNLLRMSSEWIVDENKKKCWKLNTETIGQNENFPLAGSTAHRRGGGVVQSFVDVQALRRRRRGATRSKYGFLIGLLHFA